MLVNRLQTYVGQNGFQINQVLLVAESVVSEKVDMLPRHGRYPLQQIQRFLVARRLITTQ